ncbi:MAG TPA: rhodanese-like domain-containing protein, partial [Gaiellaceae bacterium]|nr:rhodanese-like domain-containing protein [Gaiellaceae bacterium]
MRRSIDDVYAAACARLDRLDPRSALAEAEAGALVVDIRAQDARRVTGTVPGSLHIPRTVLEWRVDPDSAWRNPHVRGLDARLILICDHGRSSALAAAGLRELGFARATDVAGGFEAWLAARLPVVPAREAP